MTQPNTVEANGGPERETLSDRDLALLNIQRQLDYPLTSFEHDLIRAGFDAGTQSRPDSDVPMTQAEAYSRCGKCGECAYCQAIKEHIRDIRDFAHQSRPVPDDHPSSEAVADAVALLSQYYAELDAENFTRAYGLDALSSAVRTLLAHVTDKKPVSREEMIEKARQYGEAHRVEGGNGWALMADFASQAIKEERERAADSLERLMIGDHSDYMTLAERVERLVAELRSTK